LTFHTPSNVISIERLLEMCPDLEYKSLFDMLKEEPKVKEKLAM
jgi:hypothetical protein